MKQASMNVSGQVLTFLIEKSTSAWVVLWLLYHRFILKNCHTQMYALWLGTCLWDKN